MASFKKLSTSDVFVVPYTANKNWDLDFSCVPQDGAYFTIYKGKNLTGSVDLVDGPVTEGQYEYLVYRNVNHLYYQYASSSILNSHSLQDSLYYASAPTESGTILTGSYFNFNENPQFVNEFPTQSNDFVRVMKFNQNIYGEQIKPNCFVLTTSGSYQLVDDGFGNVYDISFTGYYVDQNYYAPPGYIAELQNKVFVGNIFYSQGVVIITNPNYKCFLPTPPNAINDYFSILNVQRTKKLDILANDYIDCNSTAIDTGSIQTYSYPGYNFPLFTITTGSLFINECETLGVTPGQYKLHYTVDDNTCLTSNIANINLELYKLPLIVSKSHQPIVCVGGVSPVTFSINYGVPPYQYSLGGVTYNNLPNCDWYQPTASLTAPIGNNILYVKDIEGTIVSSSFTVLADIFTVTTNKTNLTCYGSGDGKIAVTGSSVYGAPYSASINNGSSWQGFTTNTLFSSLTPATYNVTVKDDLCSTSSLVTITQPTLLTVTIDSTVADCPESGQDVGGINITVAGGTSPYSYSWVTGSTQVRTTEDPTGLPAGTYTVTVTDANGCIATGSAVISSVDIISITLTPTNEVCGTGNGSIAATVTGGSGGGFIYSWNTNPVKTTKDISNLSSGTYTLTVTDNTTHCTHTASASITTTPGITAVSADVTYNECDSSLVVTATGGTSPYTFVAVNGGTTKSVGPTTNPGTIVLNSGLAGGTWNITVADVNGCTATTTKTVRAREYRYSDPVCQDLNATLMIDESMGVGTNLVVNESTGNASSMYSTGFQYIQLHSGSSYAAQSPLYPPSDPGWVGNYPYASNTMSVWINGTSVYSSASVETGSANWLEYGFTGDNTKDYLIKVEAHLAPIPPTTTTTTTTTTSTTTTTTTLAPRYYRGLSCADNITHIWSTLQPAGTFNSGDRITANSGTYVIDGSSTTDPLETLYTFTATGLFGCPTTTTTTTTTIPALVVTNGAVTCSGTTGGWRSSFSGGSGTYTNVAYADSQANAVDWLDGSGSGLGVMHTLMLGDTYYDWSNVSNGTWWVAVKDSNGSISVQNISVSISCTTTTTTTTTTTASPYDFYTAEEYDCSTCTSTGNNAVLVAFPVGTSISTVNRYYVPNTPTGFVYKNFTSASPGAALIMTTLGNSINCNVACGNPTTTTTSTTTTTTTTAGPSYKTLLVNVSPVDRAAADDGYVYFDFINASTGTPVTISYNTNKSSFNTGYCVDEFSIISVYIWNNGNQTIASDSYASFGITCVP